MRVGDTKDDWSAWVRISDFKEELFLMVTVQGVTLGGSSQLRWRDIEVFLLDSKVVKTL